MATSKAAIIRGKKLGVLIQDARKAAKMSIQECASAIGVSTETFQSYELGKKAPSLPELEVLAFTMKIPVNHFWGKSTLSRSEKSADDLKLERLVPLRHKMIGAAIRKARQDAGLDVEAMAQMAGISTDELEAYEYGQRAVPTPTLETLGEILGKPVENFMDRKGPVGAWMSQQQSIQGFQELDPDLQEFVVKPINRPYLELARHLSGLDAEKLRHIAEGLLEITL
jgi:transcriptional regulator with XRE-family HTH domain